MERVNDVATEESNQNAVNCGLCKLVQQLDETYFEDNQIIIDECLKCGRKVVFLKEHRVVVDNATKFHVQKVISDLFKRAVNIDWSTVEFPSHWHCHMEER